MSSQKSKGALNLQVKSQRPHHFFEQTWESADKRFVLEKTELANANFLNAGSFKR